MGIGTDFFNIVALTPYTIKESYDFEVHEYGYYGSEANTILVGETSKEQIIFTIKKLYENETFFSEIKPCEDEFVTKLRLLN